MKRRVWLSATLVPCTALLMVGFTGSASAGPTGGGGTTHRAAQTLTEQLKVTAFWTKERMRAATPIERLLPKSAAKAATVSRGAPTVVPPTTPLASALPPLGLPSLGLPNQGTPWAGGGAVVRTAGRVFFLFKGRPASCSGDAVTSANKSTVLTAGHCVKMEGSWHTNWVFVPAYNNGNRPYGTWTARVIMATPQWVATEDLNFDVGAAVVNTLSGKKLTAVVGGQGVAFNQARLQAMYAFGYPAGAPYDGTRLIYCNGPTITDAVLSTDHGMLCDMTGGSSGGPWFLNFNPATGLGIQNSVNSFKITLVPLLMFGPYFGTDAQNLYNAAQRR